MKFFIDTANLDQIKEAQALGKEIASKLDEREKQAWDLAYEKYNRNQEMTENI